MNNRNKVSVGLIIVLALVILYLFAFEARTTYAVQYNQYRMNLDTHEYEHIGVNTYIIGADDAEDAVNKTKAAVLDNMSVAYNDSIDIIEVLSH